MNEAIVIVGALTCLCATIGLVALVVTNRPVRAWWIALGLFGAALVVVIVTAVSPAA